MLELGALGARFGEGARLRPCLSYRIREVDEALLELPRVQVLYVADLHPAVRAEDLQAPRLRSRDHGAEIAGGAATEAEEHRGGVVHAIVVHQPVALREYGSDLTGEIKHRIDHMHAAPRHAAGRHFLAVLAPMLAREAIRARAAEVALDVQQLAERSSMEELPHLVQRGLEAPVVAHRQCHPVLGTGAHRFLGFARLEAEWLFYEHMLAGARGGDDLFGVLRM